MSGTREGGLKAARKNLASDPDFYKKIGSKGGHNGTTGGFASDEVGEDGLTGRERARIVGVIGGRISKRGPGRNRGTHGGGERIPVRIVDSSS